MPHLTYENRIKLQTLYEKKFSQQIIADSIGVHQSSIISRDVAPFKKQGMPYNAKTTQGGFTRHQHLSMSSKVNERSTKK